VDLSIVLGRMEGVSSFSDWDFSHVAWKKGRNQEGVKGKKNRKRRGFPFNGAVINGLTL